MEIGKRIREVRIKTGITQMKLSELTGIPQTTISGWEKGCDLSATSLKKVAVALNCTADELLQDNHFPQFDTK